MVFINTLEQVLVGVRFFFQPQSSWVNIILWIIFPLPITIKKSFTLMIAIISKLSNYHTTFYQYILQCNFCLANLSIEGRYDHMFLKVQGTLNIIITQASRYQKLTSFLQYPQQMIPWQIRFRSPNEGFTNYFKDILPGVPA